MVHTQIIKRPLKAVKNINLHLWVALMIMGLCPTIYTTVRIFFLGQLPNAYAYSIAGQLTWVNLLYEIINEALILPLYYFLGLSINNKRDFANKLKTGLIVSFVIYAILSVFIISCTESLTKAMAVSQDILQDSITYIRIECIANLFGILYSFLVVALITIGRTKTVYFITACQLILNVLCDTFLVSGISCSANLGVNGIGVSNIITNIILSIVAVFSLNKEYPILIKERLSFAWIKGFAKQGCISGAESFIRNFAYIIMISRMVNVVGEQGTYWVANNFIWGWLLLPILQLGELIKQETAKNKNQTNNLGYFSLTTIICMFWFLLIPLYKPFLENVLQCNDADKIFEIIIISLIFYVAFAYQNVCDSVFYGRGKIHYMLYESLCTNTIYYGSWFILYITGCWTPTLIGIALLFGFGNVFDTVVTFVLYRIYIQNKHRINK